MNNKVIWMAAAFMLMFEGLMPLIAPNLWRRMFEQLLQLPEQGIRIAGGISVVIGLLLYWLVAI
ncbi:MAG: DUF2065 domain-containing protein [Brachymonas sp.]|jgi:uncharacterized protein YjeT (DUF2065 family)|nr:DUF2065 domain-containing protein [Brachymonas sp.]